LGALEIARDTISPKIELIEELTGTAFQEVVAARSFFKSADRYGSPALDPEEILAQPEEYRETADRILRAALPVTLEGGVARPATDTACVNLAATSELPTSGSLWLQAGPEGATLALRRFADNFAPLGSLESGSVAELSIPADRSDLPWHLRISEGSAEVCS